MPPTVMFAIATIVSCVYLCLGVCSKMVLAHTSSLEIIVGEQEAFWNVGSTCLFANET